jgi:hypothetical protein
MIDDSDQIAWLHNEERLQLRSDCLLKLLKAFGGGIRPDGSPEHSPKSLYGAAHDFVSHGNKNPDGIIAYYLEIHEAYN